MIALDQAGSSLAEAVRRPPPSALAPWVVETWRNGSVGGRRWLIVADDAPHLIYSETEARGGGTTRLRLTLVGARSRAIEVDHSARRFTVGVRLRAGALRPLFGVSGMELRDRSVSLELLPGTAGRAMEWLERTAEARDAAPLLGLLEGLAAAARERHGPAPDWRVGQLPDPRPGADGGARPGIPLTRFCRELGLSPRTLRQCFADEVGLAPSTVARVRRLHGALLEGLTAGGRRTWSEIAAGAGYADQSHLIRDCHALMGESPGAFATRRTCPGAW